MYINFQTNSDKWHGIAIKKINKTSKNKIYIAKQQQPQKECAMNLKRVSHCVELKTAENCIFMDITFVVL